MQSHLLWVAYGVAENGTKVDNMKGAIYVFGRLYYFNQVGFDQCLSLFKIPAAVANRIERLQREFLLVETNSRHWWNRLY